MWRAPLIRYSKLKISSGGPRIIFFLSDPLKFLLQSRGGPPIQRGICLQAQYRLDSRFVQGPHSVWPLHIFSIYLRGPCTSCSGPCTSLKLDLQYLKFQKSSGPCTSFCGPCTSLDLAVPTYCNLMLLRCGYPQAGKWWAPLNFKNVSWSCFLS